MQYQINSPPLLKEKHKTIDREEPGKYWEAFAEEVTKMCYSNKNGK